MTMAVVGLISFWILSRSGNPGNAGQPYLGWDTDEFPSDPRMRREICSSEVVYVCVYIYTYADRYIDSKRKREREIERERDVYIYIERERERAPQ